MRKYIIGALVGAALMVGVQAGASGILTGSKVTGTKEVTYNGKSIGKAAIINNLSYLPVRAVADAAGLQIDLGGGNINLSDEQPSVTVESPEPSGGTVQSDQPSIQDQVGDLQERIQSIQIQLSLTQDWAIQVRQKGYIEEADKLDAEAAQLQQQISDLEAQLQALQDQ